MTEGSSIACIFCFGSEGTSIAHIVPESLGGRGSPIGLSGVTCDRCNQYFGQKVEAKALQSFPFGGYRILRGVPSKKGRFVRMRTTLGQVEASGVPGIVHLEPRDQRLRSLIEQGKVNQLRILAEVSEPLAVARMLLKIGLEQLGKHVYAVAMSDRVSEARIFARAPRKGDQWWFVLRSAPEELFSSESSEDASIEIVEQDGVLVSIMHLPGVTTMVPLESRALPPPPESLPAPEFRVIRSVC
jgi:hypothetical protein